MKRDKKKKAYTKMKNIMRNNLPQIAVYGKSMTLKESTKLYLKLLKQGKTKKI